MSENKPSATASAAGLVAALVEFSALLPQKWSAKVQYGLYAILNLLKFRMQLSRETEAIRLVEILQDEMRGNIQCVIAPRAQPAPRPTPARKF